MSEFSVNQNGPLKVVQILQTAVVSNDQTFDKLLRDANKEVNHTASSEKRSDFFENSDPKQQSGTSHSVDQSKSVIEQKSSPQEFDPVSVFCKDIHNFLLLSADINQLIQIFRTNFSSIGTSERLNQSAVRFNLNSALFKEAMDVEISNKDGKLLITIFSHGDLKNELDQNLAQLAAFLKERNKDFEIDIEIKESQNADDLTDGQQKGGQGQSQHQEEDVIAFEDVWD